MGWLFDTTDFQARAFGGCGGNWTPLFLCSFVVTDLFLFVAYFVIATTVWLYVKPRHIKELQAWFRLFIAFVYACGATHLLAAIVPFWPVYNAFLVVNLFAAAVSIGAMVLLIPLVPVVLRYKQSEKIGQMRQEIHQLMERLAVAENVKRAPEILDALIKEIKEKG